MLGRMWKILALGFLLAWELAFLAPAAPSFADEGKATWYGPGFHGRRMANGQVYDMYDPTTVACNLYPLGTWLRVTNLANDKSITVQVRDRGAFGHALDLSFAAFVALGGGSGTLRVRYEVVSGPDAEPEVAAPDPTPTPTPTPEPTPTSPPQGSSDEHVVQAGETLSQIAAEYGMSVSDLADMNGIDDVNMVAEGQRLRLSSRGGQRETTDEAPSESPEDSASSPASSEESSSKGYYHTVQEGETLWDIALAYGLTPDELIQLNQLSDAETLSVGQTLYVSQQYEVQESDTLSRIAEKFGISVEALMAANGLQEGDFIQRGALLRIPNS